MILLLVGASLTLVAWRVDDPRVHEAVVRLGVMKPNAAVGLLLAGLALLSSRRRPAPRAALAMATILGSLVSAIGMVTLIEYSPAASFVEIDGLVVVGAGRMGINTAACLALLGIAVPLGLSRDGRPQSLSQALAIGSVVVTLVALLGYLYGLGGFYRVWSSQEMAPGTALLILALAIAVLCLSVSHGVMRSLMSQELGGQLIRNLLPMSAVAIAGSGAVIMAARTRNLFANEFDIGAVVLLSLATLVVLIFRTAGVLDRVAKAKTAAETALLDGERRYRRLADAMPPIVFTASADGRVNYANNRWFEYTGMEAGTLLRNIGRRFLHRDDVRGTAAAWRRSVASGAPYEVQYRLRDSTGQYRWHLVRAVADRDASGRIVAWIGTATDIDAQKHADRRKDEFLAMLAHELRNPLAPIVAGAQLLQQKGALDSDLRTTSRVIERQAQHLTRIVDDLLDASRAVRGKVTLRKAEVAVEDFVTNAIDSTRELFDQRRHTLRISLPDRQLWVDGDEVRLTQIVANLLNNAAKFTPEGGSVDLVVSAEEDTVVLVLSDSGIGIDPDVLPHVFEPFTQADSAAGRATGGLGIGLHLVQTLASLHGGTVTADSAGTGRGSRFTVRLPLLTHEVVRDGPPVRRPEPSRKARILLVDDNEDASLTLAMLLRIEGHDVTVACDGPEALRIAREFKPDAVLLDIGMSGMDGYEVGRRLRADPATAGVVMIAVTGYSHTDARTRSKAAGFDQHIVKPVDPAALIQSLSKVGTRPN